MLKGFKNGKIPEFTTPHLIPIPRIVCIKCGKPIGYGDFVYDKNTCWYCFETQVYRIARNTETIEENKIVIYLLKTMEEIIRRNTKNEI